MDWRQEYQEKLRTAEEAVRAVRGGDRVYGGTASSIAYRLLDALWDRREELEDVVLCGAMTSRLLPFFRPEAGGGVLHHHHLFCRRGGAAGHPERPDHLYLLPPEPDRDLVPGDRPAGRGLPGGVPAG